MQPRSTVVNGVRLSPTWGDGNLATDWAIAAKKGAERCLMANPDLLIFIEGLDFSNDLSFVRKKPLELSVPNKVVYSPHSYAWCCPNFYQCFVSFFQLGGGLTETEWRVKIYNNWYYIEAEGIAPLWIGEFGTDNQVTY